MTVDSEAIFALAAHSHGHAKVLEQLRGSMAAAWLDERLPDVVYVARGMGRPLWVGSGEHELFFASTRTALEVLERFLRLRLSKRELRDGTLLTVVAGRERTVEKFQPDMSFEEEPLPAVRAPQEAQSCLKRLALIAAGL